MKKIITLILVALFAVAIPVLAITHDPNSDYGRWMPIDLVSSPWNLTDTITDYDGGTGQSYLTTCYNTYPVPNGWMGYTNAASVWPKNTTCKVAYYAGYPSFLNDVYYTHRLWGGTNKVFSFAAGHYQHRVTTTWYDAFAMQHWVTNWVGVDIVRTKYIWVDMVDPETGPHTDYPE